MIKSKNSRTLIKLTNPVLLLNLFLNIIFIIYGSLGLNQTTNFSRWIANICNQFSFSNQEIAISYVYIIYITLCLGSLFRYLFCFNLIKLTLRTTQSYPLSNCIAFNCLVFGGSLSLEFLSYLFNLIY